MQPSRNTPDKNATPISGAGGNGYKYMLIALLVPVTYVLLELFGYVSPPPPTPVQQVAPNPPTIDLNDSHALNDAYGIHAAISCASQADNYLRRVSKWSFKWDDINWLDRKFDNHLVPATAPGVITMTSNKVSLQNEFGAFRRVTLLCSYNTKADKVLEYAITED